MKLTGTFGTLTLTRARLAGNLVHSIIVVIIIIIINEMIMVG